MKYFWRAQLLKILQCYKGGGPHFPLPHYFFFPFLKAFKASPLLLPFLFPTHQPIYFPLPHLQISLLPSLRKTVWCCPLSWSQLHSLKPARTGNTSLPSVSPSTSYFPSSFSWQPFHPSSSHSPPPTFISPFTSLTIIFIYFNLPCLSPQLTSFLFSILSSQQFREADQTENIWLGPRSPSELQWQSADSNMGLPDPMLTLHQHWLMGWLLLAITNCQTSVNHESGVVWSSLVVSGH